jgi:hypothetical protein
MAGITSYATLGTAVQTWADRAGDAAFVAQSDTLIQLSEAQFNLYLNEFQQETTVSILTSAAGVGTLPADFQTPVSLVYSTYGTLKQTSLDGINFLNPAGVGGIPYHYAISGPSFFLDRIGAITLNLTYVQGLAALSGTNASNWLLAMAPHAYLFMCMAMGEAFNSNWDTAAGLEAKALGILDMVMSQNRQAVYGRAEMTLRGVSP